MVKEAKKEGRNHKKVEKDPGIPNEWPFKEQEPKALETRRAQALQELELKKEARKERDGRKQSEPVQENLDGSMSDVNEREGSKATSASTQHDNLCTAEGILDPRKRKSEKKWLKSNKFSVLNVLNDHNDGHRSRRREESRSPHTDDVPKLLAALKEMNDGLNLVRGKVEALTRKVKKNQLLTGDGIGYLEAKHHLLLSYCQDIVYYLLRKAKGLLVDGHLVVWSLVEIRLFLEKIRPIDKKMEYQIQKLTNTAEGASLQEKALVAETKGTDRPGDEEDLLKYRPNPDMMISKSALEGQDNDGIYHPPKFMPASMDDEGKRRKQASRRDKALARMATENPYLKEIIDAAADRPEEWKETVGDESREFVKYMRQREKQEKQEEELFTRAPLTKRDKQMERQMKKQLHGLRGLTDGFDLGMNMLIDGDKENDGNSSKPHVMSGGRKKHQKSKKRKRH